MRVPFYKLAPFLATGSLLTGCLSETGLRVLPKATDSIRVDASEVVRQCLPPDESVCPIDPQTGDYDDSCRAQMDHMWDFYADKFSENGLNLAALVSGDQDFTLMAHAHSRESHNTSSGHEHHSAQLVFVPGNHYSELKDIASESWLSPFQYANALNFPPQLLAMACKAEILLPIDGGHPPEDSNLLESYDLNLYTGLDFYRQPNVYSGDFEDGMETTFKSHWSENDNHWYHKLSLCDENPNADGHAGLCGFFNYNYGSGDTDMLWQLSEEGIKTYIEGMIDWGATAAALDPFEFQSVGDYQYWSSYGASVQVYYCDGEVCYQSEE